MSAEDIARFRTLDGPTVSDAVENLTQRDRTTGFTGSEVRCLTPHLAPMIGYAVTAIVDNTTPGPYPGEGKRAEIWRAVERSPKPAVLVFQHSERRPERASVLGDVVAHIAQRCGAVGLVTNGAVRDAPPTIAIGFQLFARGTVTSRGNNTALSVGDDVIVSGMHVRMGDLIFADSNGAVLIPKELPLADLFDEVDRVRDSDRRRINMILAPDFTLDKL